MVLTMSEGKFHYHEKEKKRRISTGARSLSKTSISSISSEDAFDEVDTSQQVYKRKLKALFMKADLNHNGWLDNDETIIAINELNISNEVRVNISEKLTKMSKISFEDFSATLLPEMNQKPSEEQNEIIKNEENTLTKRSLKNIVESKLSLTMKKSTSFRKLVKRTQLQAKTNSEVIDFIDTQENDVGQYISERWDSFINFKRKGKDGEVVLTSDEQLTDALPGTYDLLQLVMDQFDSDIVASKPNHAVIKPVKWISAENSTNHGKILCPKYWNCTIPVEIGTEQNLSYYGCCYATKQQQTVALLHRHATVDFVYSENYKRSYVLEEGEGSGGCGIERHAFHHMDCPLEDNSGYFLLGKLVNEDELHLTAFKIPKNHVLYVPPNAIHSNDHMTGKWRTMLADNVPIDHVHFMKETYLSGYYDNVEAIIQER